MNDFTKAEWAKDDGLLPAIIQDPQSLCVLMLGYVNQEALHKTIETGFVTFFSRSKQRLWQKGETSGHVLRVCDIKLDCDNDAFLIQAEPQGPTCHLGTGTCWGNIDTPNFSVLAALAVTIHQRRLSSEQGSYTAQLFSEGVTRIAQKVGEEGIETALAAVTKAPNLPEEAADLLYHLLVLLEATDTKLETVLAILQQRAGKKK